MARAIRGAASVYLIRDGGIYKIGASGCPARRIAEVASPKAVLVHVIPSANAYQVERALHRRFAHCRIAGRSREWFKLTDHDVASICRLVTVASPDELPAQLQPPPGPSSAEARIPTDLMTMVRHVIFHDRDPNGQRYRISQLIDELLRPAMIDRHRLVKERVEGRKKDDA